MSVKKIVVAFDGSKQSYKALDWALDLACKYGAEVTSLTVVKPPEFSPSISEIDEFYTDAENHCREMFEKVKARGREYDLRVRTEFLRGHPAESITNYAFQNKVDLIVTGTRGMGGFKNLVIGSVAQKVVTYSKVPVLVVKE